MTTYNATAMEKIWQSGYLAYEANIPFAKCPFWPRSDARDAWEDGWCKAKHEYEDAPPED